MMKEVLVESTSFCYTGKGGMTMTHEAYKRMVPGADTAVLFLHGIVGTPNHFRDLIRLVELVPENWSVSNILLDGHGGTAADFAASSMAQWKETVRRAFEELADKHEQVVVVGHSMGTLFSVQLALEHPEKIPFLFLLAVPMRPGVRLTMMRDSLLMVFGKLKPDHVLWKAAGVSTTRRLWKYLGWLPRFLELFREINRTERVLPELRVPCVAWQSQKDELVRNAARKVLVGSSVMEVHNLMNSTHFYYDPKDREQVQQDFMKRIKELSHD